MGGSGGVVALLFTDLVSSTELLGRLGDDAAEELRRTHFSLLRDAVVEAGGEEVKSLGDGLMVAFTSPLDAMGCAVAMQRAIAKHNQADPSRALGVRVGLHVGEPVRDEADFFGTAVVVAKRLCDRAEGGQILASELITGLVGTRGGFRFLPLGRLNLKGLADPTPTVMVDWEPVAAAPPVPTHPEAAMPWPEIASTSTASGPPLVGRTGELARLEEALAGVASGRGRMALIVGEMGMGKTRLAEEALGLARRDKFLVLVGRTGQANSGLAYAPFLSAFGSFLRRLPTIRRDALVTDLPHLARLWPDLGMVPPAPLADPDLDRTLLFESVARLLERLAAEAPVALLLDDLHWADGASLALLGYLTHGLADMRVLVLVTYRPEGVAESRALRQLVTNSVRSALATEVVLAGLGGDEVVAMAEGLLGEAPPAALVAILRDRAAGTPLFVDAFVRGLLDTGDLVHSDAGWALAGDRPKSIPRGVRDLVVDRLDTLGAEERSVVELIAHGASGLPHDLLEDASGLDADELLDVVGRLVAAGLVLQEEDGADVTYRLFHPLVQEVAAAELPAVAGRRTHARLARTIERRRPRDLDRMAFHYSRAGREVDPDRALEVLLEAGERAYGLSAHEEAARHFGAALPFIRNGHRPERLADVLERLGESWDAVGETAAAVEVWTEAMGERKREGDALGAARLCRRLGLAARNRGDADSARRHLETGVAVLADLPPCEELVDLHHARLLVDSPSFDPDRATDTVAALVGLARTLSSPRAAVESLSAEGQLALGRCDYGLAQERTEEALRIAEEAGDWLLMQRARRDLVWVTWAMADLDASYRQIDEQLELDRLLGARAQEPLSRLQFAIMAHLGGRWDEVVPLAEEAITQARRYGQGRVLTIAHGTLSWFFTDRGDLDLAAQHLTEARQTVDIKGRDRVLHFIRMPEAVLALERGDAAGAQVAVAGLPLPAARALLGTAQVLAGDLDSAMATGQSLATSAVAGSYPAALADRVLGLVALARGETDAAREALAGSAAALAALGLPFETAVSQFHAGTVENVRAALSAFEALGAARHAERARRVLRSLGVRVPSPRRRRGRDDQPLSPRELEVARLVAEGLTNAEIASRLVLSTRTVESHLDHIYARLGISTRAALASWVTTAEASVT